MAERIVPYRLLISPVHPAGGLDAVLEESGATGSTIWGAKRGLDRLPRRGRSGKGQSRGIVWREILAASLVTFPSKRVKNRVLLSKGLEINDLRSSLRFFDVFDGIALLAPAACRYPRSHTGASTEPRRSTSDRRSEISLFSFMFFQQTGKT